jgi:hypothetical protein
MDIDDPDTWPRSWPDRTGLDLYLLPNDIEKLQIGEAGLAHPDGSPERLNRQSQLPLLMQLYV